MIEIFQQIYQAKPEYIGDWLTANIGRRLAPPQFARRNGEIIQRQAEPDEWLINIDTGTLLPSGDGWPYLHFDFDAIIYAPEAADGERIADASQSRTVVRFTMQPRADNLTKVVVESEGWTADFAAQVKAELDKEFLPSEVNASAITTTDVAILTILPEEYHAVCSKIKNLQTAPPRSDHPNLYAWKVGTVISSAGVYSIAVGMMGRAGTNESALATADAVERWSPRFIFFVGVAGGLKNAGKGDVVIADVIHGYEYGKIEETFVPRSNWTYKTDIGLLNGAVAHSAENWEVFIQAEPPVESRVNVTSGEIASGDKVVDDPSNQFLAEVIKAWPKIRAVEMEGAGAGNAIEHVQSLGKSVSFMMIRGISDLPRPSEPQQEDKARGTEERDAWKAYAADTAAAFTISFIVSGLPLPPR